MRVMLVFFSMILVLGCARINVETAKPLKVDINMRLDVYQHVVKDIDSIEDEIYGDQEKKLNLLIGIGDVYADDYPQGVREAIKRRKSRIEVIESYFQKGYVGENRNADLEIIDLKIPQDLKSQIASVIQKENEDRKVIYQATAQKNNVSVDDVRKLTVGDHYDRAAGGYWFEMYDDATGFYQWIKK